MYVLRRKRKADFFVDGGGLSLAGAGKLEWVVQVQARPAVLASYADYMLPDWRG